MQDVIFVEAAECLKVIAHPKRLELLAYLKRGRRNVGEIAKQIERPSHVTSEHLRLLMHCGILQAEREGRSIYYSVCEPHIFDLLKCVEKRFSKRRGK